MTEQIGGSCGEAMAVENGQLKTHSGEEYDGKTKSSQFFRRRQNGVRCGETRRRTKAEVDNRSKNFVRTMSRDTEVSLTLKDNTVSKEKMEHETLTSVFSKEVEPRVFAENAETTISTPHIGIEGFIEHIEFASSTPEEKQVSPPVRIEVSAARDNKLGQKMPAASTVKSCKCSVLDIGQEEAKSLGEDKFSESGSRRKRKTRAIDYPSELSQSPKRIGKRCFASGKFPNKVVGRDTRKTSSIFVKEDCLPKASESNLQGNGCVSISEMNSEIEKRKRCKTEILQREKWKEKSWSVDMVRTNPNLGTNKEGRITALRVKKSKQMIVSAETSEEGMVLSHYMAGNSPYIHASGRSDAYSTNKRSGHGTLAAVSNSDMVSRGSEAGRSSEIKGNNMKKLSNRKISEKILAKARVKRKSKGVLIKHQRVNLHVSSKNQEVERKLPISELRKSLRERAKDHLLAAGWKIDLRPRKERDYQDSVYISPSGLSFWSLPRAWNALKQSLDEKVSKDAEFPELVHNKRLPGNDSCSGSDLDCLIKPFDGIRGKLKLDTSPVEGEQVGGLSSFMTMIYTEDLALLKRKRRNKIEDLGLLKRKRRNKEERNKESSKKRGKNGQIIKCAESIQLFRGKIKNTNCNLQGSLGARKELFKKKSKCGNLPLDAKPEGGFKQRKKAVKASEQPKPLQVLQKESFNKNRLKGFGKAQNKLEYADAKLASTKALHRGMKKNYELHKTANLKASNVISVIQNKKSRKLKEPQNSDESQLGRMASKSQAGRKSSKSQAGRKPGELLAGKKSDGTHSEKCGKPYRESSDVGLESAFRLNKSEASLGDTELLAVSVGKKRKRGWQVAKNSNGICNSSSVVAGKNTVRNNAKNGKKKKNRRGGCGLLVRTSGKEDNFDRFSSTSKRTLLSWLIDVGAVPENEMVQYINRKDRSILKDGWVTREGILCKCCDRVLTISNFEAHAGSKLLQTCGNIFLKSGKSLTECQMQAWVEQAKCRKAGMCVIDVDKGDQNDDTCGLCGDGGNLLCCDNCPSTFHQDCLVLKDLPEGDWYCPNCTCAICATVGHEGQAIITDTTTSLFCDQCEHRYHKECLDGRGSFEGRSMSKNIWFCGEDCEKVSTGLCKLLGISNPLEGGFSWTLLRRVEEDQEACSTESLALMAECNTKLAVALVVMEECFVPMVDPRTDLDMIPHVVYNCGSNFKRLNYRGFYTVILEKEDEIISVASIRIHGACLAEMPFIGTRHRYRRQGMCRRLVSAIEEMLLSLKVEKLILPAIPDLLETWTAAFCFKPLENSHKEEIRNISMMVFPGTTLLQKSICKPAIPKHEQAGRKCADLPVAVKNVEMLDGVKNVDSEAHAVGNLTETQSRENFHASSGCEFSNEINVSDTMRETATTGELPETEKTAAVAEALLGSRDSKAWEIALGGGEERNYCESVSVRVNIESVGNNPPVLLQNIFPTESPAILKLKESIKLLPASSGKPDLLGNLVHNLHPAMQCVGDSSALEYSTASQRSVKDVENMSL